MKYQQITDAERYLIGQCRRGGFSIAETSKLLERHRSTIYREIARNKNNDGSYCVSKAGSRTRTRRSKSRRNSRIDEFEWQVVEFLLRKDWSPEQISLVLKKMTPIRISHETIYLRIWKDKKAKGNLFSHLRQHTKKKRKRYGKKELRGNLKDKRGLEERPDEANARSQKGHWEIDLVHGKDCHECLLTLVDRKTRYTVIRALPNKSKSVVRDAILDISRYHNIKTISADNGTEWHDCNMVEKATGIKFYFAKPYHSWERGTNENTNGLIRQYFKKGSTLKGVTQQMCNDIAIKLNTRPRKVLGLECPAYAHFGRKFLSHFKVEFKSWLNLF